MEAVAYTKYIRISPKKIRFLARSIKGLTPVEARNRLLFVTSKAARILSDNIKIAEANAVNNLKLNKSALSIKTIEIGKGPFFKRWQAVSRGMAHQIKKRTTHVKVVIEEIQKEEVKSKKLTVQSKTEEKKEKNETQKSEMKGEK